MSQELKIYGTRSAAVCFYPDENKYINYSSNACEEMTCKYLYIGFPIPTDYAAYKFESVSISLYFVPDAKGNAFYAIPISRLLTSWNESTLTYANRPVVPTAWAIKSGELATPGYVTISAAGHDSYTLYGWSPSGMGKKEFCFMIYPDGVYNSIYTTRASQGEKPYITITVSDTKAYLVPSVSPSSGYVPKTTAQIFNFGYTQPDESLGEITVTDYIFRYRSSSSATSYTEVDCGTSTSYTVPAGTFTTDAPQVQIQITDSGGTTTISDWYTLSTVEATSTAICTQPKNTVIDGSAASIFEWQHIISTGTAPTQSELQKSTDGTTWATLTTVSGSSTTVTLPASTFSAGEWYWRVRTYNTDSTAGEWSDAAAFSVVAAPATPTVTVDNTPRPTVKWQSTEQQGYEVVVLDGSGSTIYDSNTVYGTANSTKLPLYLDDGNYTIEVRVQNEYGLWSEFGTAGIVVANTTTATITLTVETDEAVANLSWAVADASFAAYLIYRNDELIAKVTTKSYKDLKACGSTTYKVRGIYTSNDGYGMSNAVTVSLLPSCLVISQDGSEDYIKLDLNTSQYVETSKADTASYVTTHIYGAKYPMIEISSFRGRNISFSCAFLRTDERNEALAALTGNIVTLKTPQGSMVTGLLASLTTRESQFYIAYSAAISQIDDSTEVTI